MAELTFDKIDIDYGRGSFANEKGQRKPSAAYKKVSIDPDGKLKIGTTLLDAMLEFAGIDKNKIEDQHKGKNTKPYVHMICGISSKTRGGNGKFAKFKQPYLLIQIRETKAEAEKDFPKESEIKQLYFKGRNYINKNQMRHYNDQQATHKHFKPFYFEEKEDIPIFPLDPPVEDLNGKMHKEWKLTRTDYFTSENAVDIDPDDGSIRIWGNEGNYINNLLEHQPYDPKNRKKKGK